MIKSGISHMLSFIISLVVAHAILLLFKVYIPPLYAFSLRFGEATALIFNISYNQKIMAAFVIAAIISFPTGILFHKFFKMGR